MNISTVLKTGPIRNRISKPAMVPPRLNEFYNNWMAKSEVHGGNTLAAHFDRFISLYVIFSSLYLHVMTELTLSGHELPKLYKDKKAATDYVAQYLKAKYYVTKLLDDEMSRNNMAQICTLIENEEFHIILEYGNANRDLDLELLTFLRSRNSQERAKAILSLFYHIRCNLFHGNKGFEERQRNLLLPVNHLLRKTIEIVYGKLSS